MMQRTHISILSILALVCISPSLSAAEKAPPGSNWFIHDSNGWSSNMQRQGTSGTMWDYSTVSLTGRFSGSGKRTVESDLEVHISADGALFVIRKDRSSIPNNPVRTCTYQGQADPPPRNVKNSGSYMYRFKLEGTFLCSDMDAIGTWFGEMNW